MYDACLNGAGLVLDGQSGYMSLPKVILKNKMTIIKWAKRDVSRGDERLYEFGSDTDNYFYLAPANGSAEITVDGDKNWIGMSANKITGEWHMFAVTVDGNDFSFCFNVVIKGRRQAKYTLSQVKNKDNYIGKSHFEDPYLKGVVDEIIIYNKALGEDEIVKMYNTQMALLSLKIDNAELLRNIAEKAKMRFIEYGKTDKTISEYCKAFL